ncbi:MAG: RnfABCDGE type electron transport complex subunit D [Ruminococcaceae bacterium]|nr:RnfABCDGE type electron transport complex subunit D [Oscillospiraceae bacterium]
MADKKFVVSLSPHISTAENTKTIMLDVIIALIPALIAGWFYFGIRALAVVGTSVISCVLAEYVYQWFYIGFKIKNEKKTTMKDALSRAKSKTTIGDLSAAVTGLLLAYNLPVTIPYPMVIIGSVFAIIIVKQLFGGIGHNFVNPALAARAFMLASWPVAMTSFVSPVMSFSNYVNRINVTTSATPLSLLKEGFESAAAPSLYDAFLGRIGGCIGETATVLILIGGIYLMVRRVIDARIPLAYIGSFALLVFFFGSHPYNINFVMYHLCTGGLMLGAFFMATDYVTTPTTKAGHIIFGIGCGILTFVIRRFGGYPEGVSYSILLMNVVTPLIDKYVHPRKFGEVSKRG